MLGKFHDWVNRDADKIPMKTRDFRQNFSCGTKVNYTSLKQEEILRDCTLTDMTINLAQNMLFNQFLYIQGFKDIVGRVFNFL